MPDPPWVQNFGLDEMCWLRRKNAKFTRSQEVRLHSMSENPRVPPLYAFLGKRILAMTKERTDAKQGEQSYDWFSDCGCLI